MSISLVTEPKQLVAGSTYSYFNAAHNPIIFEFQRKDLIDTLFNITNSSGHVMVTSTVALTGLSDGDYVYLYSTVYASGLYEVSGVLGTVFELADLTYISAEATGDFINLDSVFQNYYLEVQFEVDSVDYSMNSVPDSTGLIKVDASAFLRNLVSSDNDIPYDANDGGTSLNYETNLFKEFEVSTVERYNGSTASASRFPDTYYVLNSTKQTFENPNLLKYAWFDESSREDKPKFLTSFKEPTRFSWYPFELLMMGVFVNQHSLWSVWRDINKTAIIGTGTAYNTGSNTGVISGDPISHALVYPQLLTWLNSTHYFECYHYGLLTTIYSETIYVRNNMNDYCNPIYISWVNDLGGRDYWLFSAKSDIQVINQGGELSTKNNSTPLTANQKEYFIPGRSEKQVTVYADNLDYKNLDGWIDFLRQENVYVLRAKLWDDNFEVSAVKSGTETQITNKIKHNMNNDDEVVFYGDTGYSGTYTVTVIDDYTFNINKSYVAPTYDMVWRKIIVNEDWITCRMVNQSDPIRTSETAFSLVFDLIYPSYNRKLM